MRLWGDGVRTTPSVMAEHQQGVDRGIVPDGAWQKLPTFELGPEEESLCQDLPSNLGPGERSCLAVALHIGGTLATDDLYARKIASMHGVPVTGTVGILIGCIRKGLIDLGEGNRLLQAMIDHSYHSPTTHLDDFL